MDKKKATLTLTEKLNELGYINLVYDPAIKSHLLNNAESVIFDIQKSGRIRSIDTDNAASSYFERDKTKRDDLPYPLREYKEANYFFAEHGPGSYKFLVTPAALIGEIEERVLKENFYKNVPEKILNAFEVLKIPHFIEHYKTYLSLSGGQDLPETSPLISYYIPFEECETTKIEAGDIIQGSSSKMYYLVDKVFKDGAVEGNKFYDNKLKSPINEHTRCESGYLIRVKKLIKRPDPSFAEFIFNLSYADRNLAADKMILKRLNIADSCDVLLKEYSGNHFFEEYFSVLSKEVQEKVVEKIRLLPRQDQFLNSWLFSQDFDVKMDYLELYKRDTKGFINYFRKSDAHVRELIVSDLFNCEYVNEEVITFLEREYSPLLRDVSFKNESFAKPGGKEDLNIKQ